MASGSCFNLAPVLVIKKKPVSKHDLVAIDQSATHKG